MSDSKAPHSHVLKTWPEHFEAVRDGRKRVELRRNDRDYRVGDVLVLCEYDPLPGGAGLTGESVSVRITHRLPGNGQFGLDGHHIALSIEPLKEHR